MTIPRLTLNLLPQEDSDRENAETPKLERAVDNHFRFCLMKVGCTTPRSDLEKKRWTSDTQKIEQMKIEWNAIKETKGLITKEILDARVDVLVQNLNKFLLERAQLFRETPVIGSPRDPDNARRTSELDAIKNIMKAATEYKSRE
ncbi:MAG: hypothetical protein EBZ47_07510 [Chlamydiae bacterium]|nr:hypothetical protein [Chlamydiota bacterium]NDD98950.1 hypothetical protein [bacterium]